MKTSGSTVGFTRHLPYRHCASSVRRRCMDDFPADLKVGDRIGQIERDRSLAINNAREVVADHRVERAARRQIGEQFIDLALGSPDLTEPLNWVDLHHP